MKNIIQEILKSLFEEKKKEITQAIKNRATYEKWDKHSPIWVYSYVFDSTEEISDLKRIESILKSPRSMYLNIFLNEHDMETYKWMYDIIETEIDNAIIDNLTSNIDSFVDYSDVIDNVCLVKLDEKYNTN